MNLHEINSKEDIPLLPKETKNLKQPLEINYENLRQKNKYSKVVGILTLLKAAFEAGYFALPSAFQKAGISLSLFVLILTAISIFYVMNRLSYIAEQLEKLNSSNQSLENTFIISKSIQSEKNKKLFMKVLN